MVKFLSKLFISIGLVCYVIGIYNIWLSNDPNRLSFNNYTFAKEITKESKKTPTHIEINSLNINLPLIESDIKNNVWETTDRGASHLISSPVPGDVGNSIIYAHNWASLFGNLIYIRPGDEIKVAYSDGSVSTFVVKYTSTVAKNTSSILSQTKDRRITLYTCVGFLDVDRFVVVALLK